MFSLFLRLLLFFLLSNFLSAQADTNITLGKTLNPLTPPTSWLCPSGEFAFGFRPLESDPTQFLLAVFFNKVPNQTVVWTANGGNTTNNQSKAVFTQDGRLSLRDHAGNEIWNAGVNGATSAAMLDTGNFVLSSSKSATLWQTFDNPTDTILPGQTLDQGASVYSKLTDDNYSQGRFVLKLQDDGNLVLVPRAYPTAFEYEVYWSTKTNGSGSNTLVFSESTGSLYLSYPNGNVSSVFSAPELGGGYYLRATVDTDGVFRLYSFPKGSTNSNWTVTDKVADDICNFNFETFSGPCGFNSYCSNPDSQGKTQCLCPPNYSFQDPNFKFKGCKPNFTPQPCEPGGKAPFNFATLVNVDWPLSDAEQYSPMTESQCRDECLNDCFCLVAIHRDDSNNGTCWKKKFPLSNGRMGSGVDRKAFVKYSVENPHQL